MGTKTHLVSIILMLIKLINLPTVYSEDCAGEYHVVNNDKCVAGEAFEELKTDTRGKESSDFYEEDSNTILRNLQEAMNNYEPCSDKGYTCSCHTQVIANDLEPFRKEGISKECIVSSAKYGTRYKIHNHKLYREEHCMFPARCSGIEHFIKLLLPRLYDMDLVVNTRDWPQIHTGFRQKMAVFSFSKTKDYSDIMYPAWSFWAGGPAITLHPTGIGRWDLQRLNITQSKNVLPWAEKLSKGFFRGSRTSDERDTLVLLSRRKPKLVDAKYTKNQAWKSPKDTLHAEPAQEVSFEAHCQYKYLFNFRGVAASFRLKHLFLCNSLVFHVGNEWQEFYYPALKPWVHYVPLHSYPTEEELESMLKFFRKHDDLAQQIAERGYQFIWQHLRMEDVECFWEHLLTQYQKLIQYKVEAEPDMLLK